MKELITFTEPPLVVNFKALETKFKRIYYSLYMSVQIL